MTKPVVLLALGVLAALAFAAPRAQAVLDLAGLAIPCPKQCGSEANNMECPENQCCNKDGSCGLGADYCSKDAGCQSGACIDNKRCSESSPCPNNQCCSRFGYCGLGKEYCGKDCKNGPCNDDLSCADKPCPSNLCCRGKDKVCGLGGNYCSINGDAGCQSGACYYKKCNSDSDCTNNYCCKNGSCGLGRAYCPGVKGYIPLFDGLVCVLPST